NWQLALHSNEARYIHSREFLLLLCECVEHQVDTESIGCHVATLHKIHIKLLCCLHRLLGGVHCKDSTYAGVSLLLNEFLRTICSSGEFRSCNASRACTCAAIRDNAGI